VRSKRPVMWRRYHERMRKRTSCWRVMLCQAFCAALAADAANVRLVLNPYESVNWEKTTQHKANLHTHTVASGGKLFLHQVFEEYAKRGYTILAITDHDSCTRWEKSGINPIKDYGLLPVMGQEYSQGDHVNGLFSDYEAHTANMDFLLRGITRHGGFAIINHPGNYWDLDGNGRVPQETRERYLKMLDTNPLVLGIEVVNANHRHPEDVSLWDALLGASMPVRPIWGFANDDMHKSKEIGHAWNIFPLDSLDEAALRQAMLKGQYYFSVRADAHEHGGEREPPLIQKIVHDPAAQTLAVFAAAEGVVLDAEHYQWIADGQVIFKGPILKYNGIGGIGRYVRAEIAGKGGTTYTNPFGFSHGE